MSLTARVQPASQLWGIYHADLEMGDALRTVVEASTKAAAERVAVTFGYGAPWANPVTPEHARSMHFRFPDLQCQPHKVMRQSARSILQPPTTAQLRTAIEVLNKVGERIRKHTDHSLMQLPDSPRGDNYAAQIKARSIEQITRIETVLGQLKCWREELIQQKKQSISHHV